MKCFFIFGLLLNLYQVFAFDDVVFGHLIEKSPYMNSLAGLLANNIAPKSKFFIENYSLNALDNLLNRLNEQNSFLTIYYKASEEKNTIFLSGPKTTNAYIGGIALEFAETIRKNLNHFLSEWEVQDLGEIPLMELQDTGSAHLFIYVPQNIDLERFAITICNFMATTFPSTLTAVTELPDLQMIAQQEHDIKTQFLLNNDQPENNQSSDTQQTNQIISHRSIESITTQYFSTENSSADTEPELPEIEIDEQKLAELSRELAIFAQQQSLNAEIPSLKNFSTLKQNNTTPTEPAFSISTEFSRHKTSPIVVIKNSPFLPADAVIEYIPDEDELRQNELRPDSETLPPSWLNQP